MSAHAVVSRLTVCYMLRTRLHHRMRLQWHLQRRSVINVHKWFNFPHICPSETSCRPHRHTELWKITGGHLRVVRKAVEHLGSSLGGWLHVVDIFTSSKMHPDKLNMCENVWVACVKPQAFLWRGLLPLLRRYAKFRGPLSVERFLGLDAWKTVDVFCAALNSKGAAGNYKSGAITQQQIWREQCCTSFELRESFTQCLIQWAWTMQAECALCCRAGDCSSESGVNYKRGLCKLDATASQCVWSVSFSRNLSPGYTQIDALNQLFLPNRCHRRIVKQSF